MNIVVENDYGDYNATIEAIKKGDLSKVKKHIQNVLILSEKSPAMDRTFLNYAIEAENIDVFNYLANLKNIGINVRSAVWDVDEENNYRVIAYATPLEQLMFFQAQKPKHINPNFEEFKIKAMTTLKEKNAQADFNFFIDDKYNKIKQEFRSIKVKGYARAISKDMFKNMLKDMQK